MADTKLSLKLLIDKVSQRVLFAEVDTRFIDFLLTILALPAGTVTGLLPNLNMAGSLPTLYESIETLSDIYFQPGQNKDLLLKPHIANTGLRVPLIQLSVEHSYATWKFYACNICYEYVAGDNETSCPSCRISMSRELSYVVPPNPIKASSSSEGGYVKGVITYTVADNLEVKPLSTISLINLLSKFDVSDIQAVEEKVVHFGRDEVMAASLLLLYLVTTLLLSLVYCKGVRLLAASWHSKTVLTDVFLRSHVEITDESKRAK